MTTMTCKQGLQIVLLDILARILAWPPITDLLIWRAKKTPYFHLEGYMDRYWLVPYNEESAGEGCGLASWWRHPIIRLLQKFDIAIRIHHILREDLADHMHTHPWSARTFILRGYYFETRNGERNIARFPGDTARLEFGEAHKITQVHTQGCWTLFVTTNYKGTWGFIVDDVLVPWREYQGRN